MALNAGAPVAPSMGGGIEGGGGVGIAPAASALESTGLSGAPSIETGLANTPNTPEIAQGPQEEGLSPQQLDTFTKAVESGDPGTLLTNIADKGVEDSVEIPINEGNVSAAGGIQTPGEAPVQPGPESPSKSNVQPQTATEGAQQNQANPASTENPNPQTAQESSLEHVEGEVVNDDELKKTGPEQPDDTIVDEDGNVLKKEEAKENAEQQQKKNTFEEDMDYIKKTNPELYQNMQEMFKDSKKLSERAQVFAVALFNLTPQAADLLTALQKVVKTPEEQQKKDSLLKQLLMALLVNSLKLIGEIIKESVKKDTNNSNSK